MVIAHSSYQAFTYSAMFHFQRLLHDLFIKYIQKQFHIMLPREQKLSPASSKLHPFCLIQTQLCPLFSTRYACVMGASVTAAAAVNINAGNKDSDTDTGGINNYWCQSCKRTFAKISQSHRRPLLPLLHVIIFYGHYPTLGRREIGSLMLRSIVRDCENFANLRFQL